MTRIKSITLSIVISILLLWSFSANPPQGRTGGPGESTCAAAGCHAGVNPTINGHIELSGFTENIKKNKIYNLRLDLIADRGTPMRGGFQMISLNAKHEDLEAFEIAGLNSTISMSNNRTYWEHSPAKSFENRDTLSYEVTWSLDSSIMADQAIFYASANFANGNGGSSGDRIVTWSDTIDVQNNILRLEANVSATTCQDSTNGSIEIFVQGGTVPYSYFWNTMDTTGRLQDLGQGTYYLTVVDATLNELIDSFFIGPKIDTIAPIFSCLSDTLFINSCTPFIYPVPVAIDECGNTNVSLIAGKGPNQIFDPGIHIEIYEAIDESANISRCTIVIENNALIDVDIDISDLACHSDSSGRVTIITVGSNPPFNVYVKGDSLDLNNLTEGVHLIVIEDASGCIMEKEINVMRPDSLQVDVVEIQNPRNSASGDGFINVEVSGGTPPYLYLWRTEDENFSDNEDLSLLFPGEYVLQVTDSRGCQIVTDTLILDAVTSIGDPLLSNLIDLYPNPANQFLNFYLSNINASITAYEIYNIHGQRAMKGPIDIEQKINLSGLRSGLYTIILIFDDGKKGRQIFLKL